MSQRERHDQRRGCPGASIQARAEEPECGCKERERKYVEHGKHRGQRRLRDPCEAGNDFVEAGQPRLRRNQRRVARKKRRIDTFQRRRHVEGQIRRTVSIPTGIERRQDDERNQAPGQRPRRGCAGPGAARVAEDHLLFVCGRPVNGRQRHVLQPKVHAQLAAVMNDVVHHERPERAGPRHREDHEVGLLERPWHGHLGI